MKLLVDAGNSRLKWALLRDGRLSESGSVVRRDASAGHVARQAWGGIEQPTSVVVANVAGGDFARKLTAWVKRNWRLTPEYIVAAAEAHGVTNAYRDPARLGADRWAALVAARRLVRGPVCVVDCGTAITLDVMDGTGRHLGGLIVPGIDLMQRALATHTEGIPAPAAEAAGEVALLARATREAVIGGSYYAALALVDRVAADLETELGRGLTTVITGGDAERLTPLLSVRPRHVPDLVLQGMAALAGDG